MPDLLERTREADEVVAAGPETYGLREQNLLLDEMTDQSERLAKPMENGFTYARDPDGRLALSVDGQKQYLEKVFQDGYNEAERMAMLLPADWGFELERRWIELEELHEIQGLEDGEKMIVFSPVPDVVRSGRANVGGYDRKRQKMLVRIVERQADEVGIFSFSLDGSNYQAMQRAAWGVGAYIPDGLSSEKILEHRFHYGAADERSMKDCHRSIREAYDWSMREQFGGRWHAGRRELNTGDALSFIKAQPDLVTQHMTAVEEIMARALSRDAKMQLLEPLRYNLAAALDDRMAGRAVESLGGAGDTARSEGRTFDGDCPTGATTASQQLIELGYGSARKKVWGKCPMLDCGQFVEYDPCDPSCSACGANGRGGESSQGAGGANLSIAELYETHRAEQELRAEKRAIERQVRRRRLGREATSSAGIQHSRQ